MSQRSRENLQIRALCLLFAGLPVGGYCSAYISLDLLWPVTTAIWTVAITLLIVSWLLKPRSCSGARPACERRRRPSGLYH